MFVLVYLALHSWFEELFYTEIERRHAPPKPRGAWGWICSVVIGMSDDDYMEHAGLDALTFVEMIRLMIRVTGFLLVWACVVDMTTYLVSAQVSLDNSTTTQQQSTIDPTMLNSFLARSSIANVRPLPSDQSFLECKYEWDQALAFSMSLVGMWLASFYTYYQLKCTWRRITKWAQRSMAASGDAASHAILVRPIDPQVRGRGPDELLAVWQSLYPGEVHSVRVVREVGKLPKLLPKLDGLRERLASLEAHVARVRLGEEAAGGGCCDDGADHADKQSKALDKLERRLAKQKAKVDAVRCEVALERDQHCVLHEHDVGVSYFVLFKTARTATIAKQVVNVPNAHFEIGPAPTPSSVCWSSLTTKAERGRYPSSAASAIVYIVVLFLWAIPIAAVSAFMTLDNLYKYLPFLAPILSNLGSAEAFVSAFLPTLALIIFMTLLPPFCMWCAGMEKPGSIGRMQASAFVKLFRFNFIWNFLGLAIGSSLIKSMTAILEQPSEILTMLSSGLGNASNTYICFLIILTCSSLPMDQLALLTPVCTTFLKRKLGMLKEGELPPPIAVSYHVHWSKVMYSMTIGMCYASVAPITTCFAMCYLLVALALYKRNLLYVYTHAAETRGSFLPMGSGMLLLILGTAQLLLAAIHIAKGSVITFALLMPLLIFTYLAHAHISRNYVPQLDTLPLAAKLDESDNGTLVLQTAPAALTDMQIKIASKLMHRSTGDTLDTLFGSAYTQPELLHPEITDPPPPPSQRTKLVFSCCWGGEEPINDDGERRVDAPRDSRASRAAVFLHDSSQIIERDGALDNPRRGDSHSPPC